MILISPSLLSADFAVLGKEVRKITKAGADLIHFDVMDGHFVPNITFGPMILSAIRKYSNLSFEAHLMIEQPDRYWKRFSDAGADIIGFHIESRVNHNRLIHDIHKEEKKVCIVVNPPTKIITTEKLLSKVDVVLVMTVNPGFGGQKFITSNIKKIEWLDKERKKHNYNFLIEVDGGINYETASLVKQAGADIIVAGSFIFGNKNYKQVIKKLKCC
ncbi:MAG TPA: ribulose-phosphate 3-epimerase [bacterium]|nr:ribulose-phosphate 3-epimerase [bacterium]